MTRLSHTPSAAEYDPEDRAALFLLEGVLGGSGIDHAFPHGNRPEANSGAAAVQQGLATVVPLAEVAFRALAAATMKAQARGRIPRKGHEWADVVLSFDLSHRGDWLLIGSHLPLAIAAGIDPDAIQALREGRLDDLAPDDRQHVEFVRHVVDGTVTDESWRRQLALVGSERGVVEQICLVFQLLMRIRIAQALGASVMSDEELDAMLDGYRRGELPVADIGAYEGFYERMAWPPPMP